MLGLRFVLEGRPGTIRADAFLAATRDFLDILRDVDRVVSGVDKGTLAWNVQTLEIGSLVAGFAPTRRDEKTADYSRTVTDSAFDGMRLLDSEPRVPENFSTASVGRTSRLARRIGRGGVTGMKVVRLDDHRSAPITLVVADNAKAALSASSSGIGSVMGRLEMISVHRRPYFNVYDARTRRAVRCDFDREKDLEQVKAALGRRVLTAGILQRNRVGQTVRVKLSRLEVIPPEDQLPSVDDIVGMAPDFTGGMSTDEYLEYLRDA